MPTEREAEWRKQEHIAREKQEQERITREHTAPPELDTIDAPYVTLKNANVREQPDAKSPRVATLSKGSEVTALGKVKGKNWYLVSRGGKKLGYVFGPLLSELGTERIAREKRELLLSGAKASDLSPCRGKYFNWHRCFGTHTFVNGDTYVGEWRHGEFHGQGRYIDVDGNIREGIWNYNKFKGKDPKIDERRKAEIETGELKFRNLKLRAKQGNVDAQFKLGVMYEDGKGVPRAIGQRSIGTKRDLIEG